MGVPHESVQGLPAGTYQSDNVHEGQALGLNNDPKQVFKMIKQDGELLLHVSGEIYGGLTTKASFNNYHLSMKVKWGDKKWPPRLQQKRDSGVLYHCYGEHGAFWSVWKSCLEYQVQEQDFGDFIPLAGPKAQGRASRSGPKDWFYFDLEAEEYIWLDGYTHAKLEPDNKHGEWNTIDLYVYEDTAIHVVNGQVVFAIKNAQNGEGKALKHGQIQLQSEAAECFYKDIHIAPIKKLPKKLRKQARL